MATAGFEYTADFVPVVGASLTGLTLVSVVLPTAPAAKSLSITRKIDAASPKFYSMCSSGSGFKTVGLGLRKSGGGNATGASYLVTLTDVTVTTITHNSNGTDVIVLSFGGMTSNVPTSVALSVASATAMIR